jgi:hypothetical protein
MVPVSDWTIEAVLHPMLEADWTCLCHRSSHRRLGRPNAVEMFRRVYSRISDWHARTIDEVAGLRGRRRYLRRRQADGRNTETSARHTVINHVFVTNFSKFKRAVDRMGCVYTTVDKRYYPVNEPSGEPYFEINLLQASSPGPVKLPPRAIATTSTASKLAAALGRRAEALWI